MFSKPSILFSRKVLAALPKPPPMSRRKTRPVATVLNPAPEGSQYMQMKKAEEMVAKGRAEFLPGTNQLRIFRDGEREMIRLEMAARSRRHQEQEVNVAITASRFSAISWSGDRRRTVPAFEREALKPIAPGIVVS